MSDFAVMSTEEIAAHAEKLGCEVVVAKPNQLQFDLDSQESVKAFHVWYQERLRKCFKTSSLATETWKSKGGNEHIVVELPLELSVPERTALQVMGGSDPVREHASLCCHWDGADTPILLFRPLKAVRS